MLGTGRQLHKAESPFPEMKPDQQMCLGQRYPQGRVIKPPPLESNKLCMLTPWYRSATGQLPRGTEEPGGGVEWPTPHQNDLKHPKLLTVS